MYTGATTGSTEHSLGASVVKQLSEPLRGKGYHLYFDNSFQVLIWLKIFSKINFTVLQPLE